MNSQWISKLKVQFILTWVFTLHTWFMISAVGVDNIIDLIWCWAGCYLSVISFSFFLHQLVWKPGSVFPHQRKDSCWVFPHLIHMWRPAGRLERGQTADGGDWQPLSSASGNAGRVSARCCRKRQFVKLIRNCLSACSYLSLLTVINCNQ